MTETNIRALLDFISIPRQISERWLQCPSDCLFLRRLYLPTVVSNSSAQSCADPAPQDTHSLWSAQERTELRDIFQQVFSNTELALGFISLYEHTLEAISKRIPEVEKWDSFAAEILRRDVPLCLNPPPEIPGKSHKKKAASYFATTLKPDLSFKLRAFTWQMLNADASCTRLFLSEELLYHRLSGTTAPYRGALPVDTKPSTNVLLDVLAQRAPRSTQFLLTVEDSLQLPKKPILAFRKVPLPPTITTSPVVSASATQLGMDTIYHLWCESCSNYLPVSNFHQSDLAEAKQICRDCKLASQDSLSPEDIQEELHTLCMARLSTLFIDIVFLLFCRLRDVAKTAQGGVATAGSPVIIPSYITSVDQELLRGFLRISPTRGLEWAEPTQGCATASSAPIKEGEIPTPTFTRPKPISVESPLLSSSASLSGISPSNLSPSARTASFLFGKQVSSDDSAPPSPRMLETKRSSGNLHPNKAAQEYAHASQNDMALAEWEDRYAGHCYTFLKTGFCAHRATCKYKHEFPEGGVPFLLANRQMNKDQTNATMDPQSLPIRPGVPPCTAFLHFGTCKFGAKCAFDHSGSAPYASGGGGGPGTGAARSNPYAGGPNVLPSPTGSVDSADFVISALERLQMSGPSPTVARPREDMFMSRFGAPSPKSSSSDMVLQQSPTHSGYAPSSQQQQHSFMASATFNQSNSSPAPSFSPFPLQFSPSNSSPLLADPFGRSAMSDPWGATSAPRAHPFQTSQPQSQPLASPSASNPASSMFPTASSLFSSSQPSFFGPIGAPTPPSPSSAGAIGTPPFGSSFPQQFPPRHTPNPVIPFSLHSLAIYNPDYLHHLMNSAHLRAITSLRPGWDATQLQELWSNYQTILAAYVREASQGQRPELIPIQLPHDLVAELAQEHMMKARMASRTPVPPQPQPSPPPMPSAFGKLGGGYHGAPELPREDQCKICSEREIDSVVLPCRHYAMCFACAQHVQKLDSACPICNQRTTSVIQIHKA